MRYWEALPRVASTKNFHTKLVLKHKRDEKNSIQKCKAGLVVCGIEKDGLGKEWFFILLDSTAMNLPICLSKQRATTEGILISRMRFHKKSSNVPFVQSYLSMYTWTMNCSRISCYYEEVYIGLRT